MYQINPKYRTKLTIINEAPSTLWAKCPDQQAQLIYISRVEPVFAQRTGWVTIIMLPSLQKHREPLSRPLQPLAAQPQLLRAGARGHYRASHDLLFMALLLRHGMEPETSRRRELHGARRYTPQQSHQNPYYYI